MVSGGGSSAGSTVTTFASCFACCAFPRRLDESDQLHLAGPLELAGTTQRAEQPTHRPSMSVTQSRRNTSVSVPRTSRMSFDVRPASILSAKIRRSRASHPPLPVASGTLRPPSLTPTLPERRAVSPLPDFSQLRTSQILELSSMPWLLVHSFGEDNLTSGGLQSGGVRIPPEDSHVTITTGHGSLLISSEDLSKIPVPPVPNRPQDADRPRARSNTAPSIPSSKSKARRKKTLSTSRKEADVENAVQELRSIVDEKRGDGTTQPNFSMRLRSNSFHHVPAVAPAMKMPVGTELLSDIGSAFSKPLTEGNDTFLPAASDTGQRTKKPSGEITTFGHRPRRSTISDRISSLFSPDWSVIPSKTPTPQRDSVSVENTSENLTTQPEKHSTPIVVNNKSVLESASALALRKEQGACHSVTAPSVSSSSTVSISDGVIPPRTDR